MVKNVGYFLFCTVLLFYKDSFGRNIADIECGKSESSTDCLNTALGQFKQLGCEIDLNKESNRKINRARTVAFKNCTWAIDYNDVDRGTPAYDKRAEKKCRSKGDGWEYVKNLAPSPKFPGVCLQKTSDTSGEEEVPAII